ncbi:glutamate receptor ionotropic, kainate glr-3-like [Penaeus vannamei]|uniref:glutamate receptor ionotropic, kainate glr-3-like n=1 Tax=Penaeus vannamei TaxID=6689 RepID=UPI00387F57DE
MCCFLTMSVQRKEVIDFSEPVYQEEFILTYKRPVLEPDITGFIKPFAPLTWFYLAVGMLLVFGMMALMHRGSSLVQFARGSAVRRTSKGGVATSIERSAQWTLSALFSQAVPWEPSMTSTRVMAGLWLLTSFVLGTVYRSNLKAMLIIPLVRLPFDTVKELADSSVPLYITHGSFLHQLIVETPASQPIGQLRKQMVAHRNVISQVNMLRSGKVAYAGLRLPFLIYLNYDFAQTGKCMTYFFSERIFQSASVSCGFPKGSPLKDKIDTIILRLKATGIINYLATRELTHVKACLLPVQNDVSINNLQTLKLKDFYGIFIVYFAGMALSSLICMVELLLGRLSPQTSPHPRPAPNPTAATNP